MGFERWDWIRYWCSRNQSGALSASPQHPQCLPHDSVYLEDGWCEEMSKKSQSVK